MSQPATGTTLYFLGINGQQSGPYTEQDMLSKIAKGEIPVDGLIWYDGLAEWQAVVTIPVFKKAMEQPPQSAAPQKSSMPAPAPTTPGGFKPLSAEITNPGVEPTPAPAAAMVPPPEAEPGSQADSPSFGVKGAEPVFGVEESSFSQGGGVNQKMKVLVAGTILCLLGGGGYYYYYLASSDELGRRAAPEKNIKAPVLLPRDAELRKALSELMLTPVISLETLKKLVRDNPNDETGKQSVQALVEYYGTISPKEAGKVLMDGKRPFEAIPYFMKDPVAYGDVEQAYALGFDLTTDPKKKKEALIEQIRVLLSPLNQKAKAIERIRLYEKTFPGDPHPFQYYLKPAEAKLRDLFDRISFFYVQSLLSFLDSEMKQINFEKRPLVELRKEKDGSYRIVGSYSGDITLNRDRMEKVNFTFWLVKGQWVIVDTNLTAERQKWTKMERERLKDTTLSADAMIEVMESVFKTQFPKTAVHETPAPTTAKKEQ